MVNRIPEDIILLIDSFALLIVQAQGDRIIDIQPRIRLPLQYAPHGPVPAQIERGRVDSCAALAQGQAVNRDAAIVVDGQRLQTIIERPGTIQGDIPVVVDLKVVVLVAAQEAPVLSEKKVKAFDVIFDPVVGAVPLTTFAVDAFSTSVTSLVSISLARSSTVSKTVVILVAP